MAKTFNISENWEDWKCGDYSIVKGDDGKFYQYYSFVNTKTGEEAFQIAEYLFDAQYVSREDAEQIVGKDKLFV